MQGLQKQGLGHKIIHLSLLLRLQISRSLSNLALVSDEKKNWKPILNSISVWHMCIAMNVTYELQKDYITNAFNGISHTGN